MVIEELQEMFFRQDMAGGGLQGIYNVAHQPDMGENLLAEHALFFEDTGFGKTVSGLGQHQVALFGISEVEQVCRLNQGKEIVKFQLEMAAKLVEVFSSAARMHEFDESGYVADGDMRQYLIWTWSGRSKRACLCLREGRGQQLHHIFLRAGHDAIDEIDQLRMRLALRGAF